MGLEARFSEYEYEYEAGVPEEVIEDGELTTDEIATELNGRPVPTEEQLWDLCRHVGVSTALLGETFKPGWAKIHLSASSSWRLTTDVIKINLARAMLKLPDVLMLYQIEGAWSAQEQSALSSLVHAYIDGSDQTLESLLTKHHTRNHKALHALA